MHQLGMVYVYSLYVNVVINKLYICFVCLFHLCPSDHISDALSSLHWLRNASGTRSFTAMYLHTLSRSFTFPTFQVAVDFALPAANASSSLRFTDPLLAAEHFPLLASKCGTACYQRLRRHCLWRLSTLDSRRFCSVSRILTFDSNIIHNKSQNLVQDLAEVREIVLVQ